MALFDGKLKKRLRRDRIARRMFQISKEFYHMARGSDRERTIVFILGCQRSGTTLMYEIFAADLYTKVYPETCKLTSDWDGVNREQLIRLNSLESVQRELEKDNAPLIVLKPIVESQNAPGLLSNFGNTRALWMYRDYRDVISSNIKNWGLKNGINDLRPVVESDPHNWRSQNVPPHVRELILSHFSEEMNPYDAAALFWYMRNQFYFEYKLKEHKDVMIFRYRNLVADPAGLMRTVYEFIGHPFPGPKIVRHVHGSSVGKGKKVDLSPGVEALCEEMMARLDAAYKEKPYYMEAVA